MGKPGKREMKHSKAINGTKHKLKAKKDAFNCKRAAPIASSSGTLITFQSELECLQIQNEMI